MASIASTPNVILAGSGLKVQGLQGIKNDPKFAKLNYGSLGTGTMAHLSLDYFFKMIMKTDATHVPKLGELGIQGMDLYTWGGVCLSTGTATDVISKN